MQNVGSNFLWWLGVVEDRFDPEFLGRVRVRIFSHHSEDKQELPTEALPWAFVVIPNTSLGDTVGFKEGDVVLGFFKDMESAQEPVVFGLIPGKNTVKSNPEKGYFDPTPQKSLNVETVPRPPEMSPVSQEEEKEQIEVQKFSPDILPKPFITFGELIESYNTHNGTKYPFDVNLDKKYDSEDASLLTFDANRDGKVSKKETKFIGNSSESLPSVKISRYPLEHKLGEPSTPRLARGEEGKGKIEQTIVSTKKASVKSFEAADHENSGVGTDEGIESEAFQEPETEYDAKYPYNHVKESESGHIEEIDDTPGKERLNWHHRSGSFREMHPKGDIVDKSKKDYYNISEGNSYHGSEGSVNITSKEESRFRAEGDMMLKSGKRMTFNVGEGDCTLFVEGGNLNIKVAKKGDKGQVTMVVQDSFALGAAFDIKILTDQNVSVFAKQNIKLKCDESIIVESKESTFFKSAKAINFECQDFNVLSTKMNFNGFAGFTLPVQAIPLFTLAEPKKLDLPPEVKDAEVPQDATPATFSPKEGYIWNQDSMISGSPASGDLWKPESDTSPVAVILSKIPGVQSIYQALPTGELVDALIEYKNLDGSIISWNVKRPKFYKGEKIETSTTKGSGFLGDRSTYKLKELGSFYGGPLIIEFASGNSYLIVDAESRHEAF
jgi:hypothetical protein